MHNWNTVLLYIFPDAKGATVKAAAHEYIDGGRQRSITTPEQFARSIVHNRNLTNTHIILAKTRCPPEEKKRVAKIKNNMKNVKKMHDVEFTQDPRGIRLRQYSGIGQGVFYDAKDLNPVHLSTTFEGDLLRHGKEDLPISEALKNEGLCKPEIEKPVAPRKPGPFPKTNWNPEKPEIEVIKPSDSTVYECPKSNCEKTFMSEKTCGNHAASCKNKPKKTMSTRQIMTTKIISKVQQMSCDTTHNKSGVVKTSLKRMKGTKIPERLLEKIDAKQLLKKNFHSGFGISKQSPSKPYDPNVRKFAMDAFEEGNKTGVHISGEIVAQNIQNAPDENGEARFTYKQYLSAKQVKSLFSSQSRKKKNKQKGKPHKKEKKKSVKEADDSEEPERTLGRELSRARIRNSMRKALEEEEDVGEITRKPNDAAIGEEKMTKIKDHLKNQNLKKFLEEDFEFLKPLKKFFEQNSLKWPTRTLKGAFTLHEDSNGCWGEGWFAK